MRPAKNYVEEFSAQSGKLSDKWASYLPAYDFWFSALRDKPVRILEIGIQNGGHLEVLARYFRSAEIIVGCDINPLCAKLTYQDSRINVIVGDANKDDTQRQIAILSEDFDIIIDDGSHTQHDIIVSFCRYFPKLKIGGVYIAEDLHTSYWRDFGGGLFDPLSSMGFFRRLADVINFEHWRNSLSVEEFISPYEAKYQVIPPPEVLDQIHLVAFQNSVCTVLKERADKNRLGSRVVVGNDPEVDPASRFLNGSTLIGPDESNNPLSSPQSSPEFLIQERRQTEKIRNSKIGRLLWSLFARGT